MSVSTRRAIYGKLAGDGTLTGMLGTPATNYNQSIYYQQAPPRAAFPFVVLSKQSGTPTYAMTASFDSEVWLAKAVDKSTTADQAEAIQARLDALLTDGSLSISGRSQMYLRRESDVDYVETEGGETYRHAGGLYRLVHQPT